MPKPNQPATRSGRGRKDVNPRLDADPLDLARCYALGAHWTDQHRFLALSILEDLSSGRVRDALSKVPVVHEFVGDSILFNTWRQFLGFWTKVPYPGDVDVFSSAFQQWKASERQCGKTNRRFERWGNTQRFDAKFGLPARVLNYAKSYIADVLPRVEGCLPAILGLARDGPGIAIGTESRRHTARVFKYTRTVPVCYQRSLPLARDFYLANPKLLKWLVARDSKLGVMVTETNRLTFVPKSMKTLRSIAIEPSVSMKLQLGVHEYLKRLFEKRGVAILSDQRVNQELARIGSLYPGLDGLSTVDLSSASDTISYELVRFLMPDDWFSLLDSLRSTYTSFKGERIRLNKFSSMGNGTTFALETLIFKAIAEGARYYSGSSITSVYGDDIVIDSRGALLLREALSLAGLSFNMDKSFILGAFKESCGADWLSGDFVTPIYLRSRRLRRTDFHRVFNELKNTGQEGLLRQFLLKKLSDSGPTIFGLENEDTSSCVFTSLSYLKGCGQAHWSVAIQNWRFKGITQKGADADATMDELYFSALLNGTRNTPERGRVRSTLRWFTAGRKTGGGSNY